MEKIYPFSEESLAKALSNEYTTPEVVKTKNHYKYLLNYLGVEGLSAQAIVIEEDYISKDFLHDYAAYYALCFKSYPKSCRRIHFFKTTITEELFQKAILESKDILPNFWDSYLGFIVVKPIPTTVIGFSVLKNYNHIHTDAERQFWGLRKYKVHIFGHEEEFDSLAFQEQDSVLAACATISVWSMLNKASLDFHTMLKSPSQITIDAGSLSPDGNRLFPNKGLSVEQICQAILSSGLVPEVKQPDYPDPDIKEKELTAEDWYVSNDCVRKIVNAHSPLGIPIILVISVPDGDNYGLHAISVLGHRQTQKVLSKSKSSGQIKWTAENINRLYAHDDQWGPFVRLDFLGGAGLKTPWTEAHESGLPTKVTDIIVPVYPKVRISYEDIEAIVLGIDGIFSKTFFRGKIKHDLAWDIKINLSETYKKDIKMSKLSQEEKLRLLTKSFPKYLWIVDCYIGRNKILEFIFDATDVNNGMIGIELICYLDDSIRKTLYRFLKKNRNRIILKSDEAKRANLHYYDFLLAGLK